MRNLKAREKYIVSTVIIVLLGLVLTFEVIRDCFKDGDFIGYIHAGNAVLTDKEPYSDHLNTWPPFFSIFCVPLALINNISAILSRFIWLLSSLVAMYFIMKLTIKMLFNKP